MQRRAGRSASTYSSPVAKRAGSAAGPWPSALGQGPPIALERGFGTGERRIASRPDSDEPTATEAASRYEPLDVPPLLPFWLGCLLAAFVGGVLLTVSLGYPLATHQQYRGPLKTLPPAPRLELSPHYDLQRYEAAKRQELRGSPTSIPIEAAMRETAQQGWGPPK
jgi:hypothetical protein